MKKRFFGPILLLVVLSTYTPKFSFIENSKLNIKEILIENNRILSTNEIKQKIDFLYEENLFLLDNTRIKNALKKDSFVESFSIKKIYPNKLKIVIFEKQPIAILLNNKKKFFILNNGDIINFKEIVGYKDLPVVLGKGDSFYSFHSDLKNIKFPIKKIKSFYFFESGRWDLIMYDGKVIKLPIKNYLLGLKNFIKLQQDSKINKYKIFDYRIKDQIILN